MATKKTLSEIITMHKPKNFKFKFIFKNDETFNQLIDDGYDMESLDTINNDDIIKQALESSFNEYDRDTVAKAKVATIIDSDRGVILSKSLIAKADKKLLTVGVGYFIYEKYPHVCIKFNYEDFDIIEIFSLL